jgi:hypothetical protein
VAEGTIVFRFNKFMPNKEHSWRIAGLRVPHLQIASAEGTILFRFSKSAPE